MYTFSLIVCNIIPISVKCIHSATKKYETRSLLGIFEAEKTGCSGGVTEAKGTDSHLHPSPLSRVLQGYFKGTIRVLGGLM